MRSLVFAAVAATVLASPALAQERAPFTGPRAEAVVGWDRLGDTDGAGSSDGVVYGGQIGYDVQAGRAIVGVEGEITGSTNDATGNGIITAGDRIKVSAGRDLYAGVRAGVAVGPRAMVYANGGYTNARIDSDYTAGTVRLKDHSNLDGYRLGAGAEFQLTGNTYLKGEYRYSNYGDDSDLDRHQVLGGVGVRF